MAVVTLEHLTKIYPDAGGAAAVAVNDIHLEIRDGELMVLVGPSGCGKSTTLRMIAGLEPISDGRITIDGVAVNDVAPGERDIAMVFQNYALYPHMSVYENLAFGLKLRKLPRVEIDARVREAAAMLGIESYLDRKPKALSGGQRQRVAVGRALVRKPKVFLFDEPLSNLDAKMRVATRLEIAKLHARLGATMIYVTHDQTEAMTLGDRICVMQDGRIAQVAAPLEVYHRPANLFVAGFIGSPPMNLLRGSLVRDAGGGRFVMDGNEAWQFELTPELKRVAADRWGRPIFLGIRPEDVRLGPGGIDANLMTANVELCEPMGAETFVHLQAKATALVARTVSSDALPSLGEVSVTFDLRKAHLFDPESGQRLAGGT